MKESYRKDPASHPDPESCGGGREAAGEALTGAHAGQPLSCEITFSGVPTPSTQAKTKQPENRRQQHNAAHQDPNKRPESEDNDGHLATFGGGHAKSPVRAINHARNGCNSRAYYLMHATPSSARMTDTCRRRPGRCGPAIGWIFPMSGSTGIGDWLAWPRPRRACSAVSTAAGPSHTSRIRGESCLHAVPHGRTRRRPSRSGRRRPCL
jgi:hypothetical protein